VLQEADAGKPVDEICSEHHVSKGSFYRWKAKYGGMDVGKHPTEPW